MAAETYLGFDFGLSRIGVAVGQSVTGTANPLVVLKARDGIPDWGIIEKLIREWKPARVIVGLPLNMDGTKSDMTALAEKFARKLHGRFGVAIAMADERLTSNAAKEYVEDGELLDAIAAKLIIETWLSDAEKPSE